MVPEAQSGAAVAATLALYELEVARKVLYFYVAREVLLLVGFVLAVIAVVCGFQVGFGFGVLACWDYGQFEFYDFFTVDGF